MQMRTEMPDFRLGAVHDMDGKVPPALLERRVQRFHDTLALGAVLAEAVLHHVLYQYGFGGGRFLPALATAFRWYYRALVGFLCLYSRVTLLVQKFADFVFGEIAGHRNGEGDNQTRVVGTRLLCQDLQYGFGMVSLCPRTTAAAVQLAQARVQQFQVVVKLGHGNCCTRAWASCTAAAVVRGCNERSEEH